MSSRLTACLLGAWILGSLAMFLVATHNFRAVDQLLAAPAPPASEMIQTLGPPPRSRILLRYLSSELNRWYFVRWEWTQIALLAAMSALTFRQGHARRTISLLLLLLTMAERFAITPEVIRLGRLIDFLPPETGSPERFAFWRLHGMYSSIEVVKMLLGIGMAMLVLRRDPRDR